MQRTTVIPPKQLITAHSILSSTSGDLQIILHLKVNKAAASALWNTFSCFSIFWRQWLHSIIIFINNFSLWENFFGLLPTCELIASKHLLLAGQSLWDAVLFETVIWQCFFNVETFQIYPWSGISLLLTSHGSVIYIMVAPVGSSHRSEPYCARPHINTKRQSQPWRAYSLSTRWETVGRCSREGSSR